MVRRQMRRDASAAQAVSLNTYVMQSFRDVKRLPKSRDQVQDWILFVYKYKIMFNLILKANSRSIALFVRAA